MALKKGELDSLSTIFAEILFLFSVRSNSEKAQLILTIYEVLTKQRIAGINQSRIADLVKKNRFDDAIGEILKELSR